MKIFVTKNLGSLIHLRERLKLINGHLRNPKDELTNRVDTHDCQN